MNIKLNDTIEINGNKLTKKYIESLTYDQRKDLIDPIFNFMREYGFPQPDKGDDFLLKEYKRLQNASFDLTKDEIFNNSSLATYISKHFTWDLFYDTKERKGKNGFSMSVKDVFFDDEKLKKIIFNRLGGDWYLESIDKKTGKILAGVNEAFNLTPQQIITGSRSSRAVSSTSIFKPDVAKFIYQKYSNEGDTIFDYSCGWGARLLGAVSCNRKYIGTDPLTTECLQNMVDFFKFENVQLIKSGSENVNLDENSVDFSFSSPPYLDQEVYSQDMTQAYMSGDSYFYDIYWTKTLQNVKKALKPNKYFGLNITDNYPKMLELSKQYFGEIVDIVKLKTVRSHLTKSAGITKYEPVYIFINNK